MIAPIATLALLVSGVIFWIGPRPEFTLYEAMAAVPTIGGSLVAVLLWLARSVPTGSTALLVMVPPPARPRRPLSRSLQARPRAPAKGAVDEDAETSVFPVVGGAAFDRAARLLRERGPDPDGEEDSQ